MYMSNFRKLLSTLGVVGALLASGNTLAQLTVSLSDEVGAADGTFEVALDFQGDGDSDSFEGNILWDGTNVATVDLSGCADGSNGDLGALSCQDVSMGTDGNLRIQISGAGTALENYTGVLIFELDGALADGDVIPVTWDEASLFGGNSVTGDEVDIASTDGSMTIAGGECLLSINPASHDFGTLGIGDSASQPFTITNDGDGDCTGFAVAVSGNAEFSLGATDCGATLGAGASCSADADFSPGSVGSFTGSLDATADGGAAASAALSGEGDEDVTPPPPTAIPTMNAMGLALMALLMLMIGAVGVRTFRS